MISAEHARQLPRWFAPTGPEADVVVATRVRLARNLARYRFPYQASLFERKTVFDEIGTAVQESERLGSWERVNFSSLEQIDQQFMAENRAVSPDILSLEGDRGVVLDGEFGTSIMINEEDHLRIQAMEPGYGGLQLWDMVNWIDDELGRKLQYAFDEQRGFLTCCPTNSGTGLRVSFLMHLPGLVLTKTVDQVLQGASQMGVSTRGFFGEHSQVFGNFFQLSNQATFGATETESVENTQSIIRKVMDFERAARERVLRDARIELEDKVFRSYGILLHARTLSMGELLNLTSALRFGLDCGIFERVSAETLNRMIMLAMPAHLQLHHEQAMSEDEVGIARARLVQEFLGQSRGGQNP